MDAADAPPPPTTGASSLGRPRISRRRIAVELGTPVLRTAPWRGRDDVVLVVPRPGSRPTADEIAALARSARDRGVDHLLTGALSPAEQHPFTEVGFQVHDRLHLLSHDLVALAAVAPRGEIRLRRARRRDMGALLIVDGRAFDGFWRLDRDGVDEAIHATAAARVRVAVDREGAVIGYAVTGQAADQGYVQRLAVDPTNQRQGTGAALVLDGLRWLRRHRALSAVVNTQVTNHGALALYQRLGFALQPQGLLVLALPLGPRPTGSEPTEPGVEPWS